MDAIRFDALTRLLDAPSARRRVLQVQGIAAVSLGFAGTRIDAAYGKKRKRKLKRNQFGCVNVGKPCRGKNGHCCSGICEGKKPKKGKKDRSRCAAHGEDSCQKGQHLTACGGQTVQCTTSTGDVGSCRTTTGQAGYCAADGQCRRCGNDADCRPFCGPDAACVVCDSVLCEFGTQCVGPTDDGCAFPP
jgi:hypothetical protein